MFEGTSFGKTVDLLQRSMDVATLRRQVIADNIANADVPNFKRSVVDFESSLKRVSSRSRIGRRSSSPSTIPATYRIISRWTTEACSRAGCSTT